MTWLEQQGSGVSPGEPRPETERALSSPLWIASSSCLASGGSGDPRLVPGWRAGCAVSWDCSQPVAALDRPRRRQRKALRVSEEPVGHCQGPEKVFAVEQQIALGHQHNSYNQPVVLLACQRRPGGKTDLCR